MDRFFDGAFLTFGLEVIAFAEQDQVPIAFVSLAGANLIITMQFRRFKKISVNNWRFCS
jgi:hypothetical protein